ncbi:dodecin domain-containing protein [archaeon]|nr:MAG: dodecin domain-containing protein [archaeon]
MSVVKVIECVATSPTSWQDAVENGIKETNKTVRHIVGADVLRWKCEIEDGKITEYRVDMKIAYVVER